MVLAADGIRLKSTSTMFGSTKFLVLQSLLSALLFQFPTRIITKSTESRVVCYYTNWSAYRQGPAKFLPDNINPYLCTHLIYAFGGLTSDAALKPFDKYQDIDKGGYTKFNGLKTYNKGLKTLLAIGGWNEGSGRFSRLVADAESRKTFVKNSVRFLRQHHFDGLDLDWEYPAAREGGQPADKKNYAIFIKELREAFEEESKGTGRTRLLLTIAVPAGIEWIQKGFDIPSINRNVDFFNLLTYDFHASTEPAANHHAPLKPKDGFSDYDYKSQLNIEYAINYYLDEGADADKLVVGLPTYGRSYTLFNPESTDVGAPASGPGTKGKYTKEPGYLAYYEICEGIKAGEWRVENDLSDTQGPHAVKDDQWVGYDDTRIMAIKAKWVRDQKLGGIMFWSIDNDDFRGFCDGKAFPLIEAAKIAYYTGESPEIKKAPTRNSNSRFSIGTIPKRTTTTPAPPSTTTAASKPSRKSSAKKAKTPRPRRRRIKPKTTVRTTTTTTTPPPVTHDPLRTPPPPTTPETSVDFECKDDGFFAHPKDCKKYFWCLDAPGLGIVAHHFTCPAGLFFNKNTDSCDYSRNVPCKPGGTTTTTTVATTTTTTTTPSPPEEQDEYYDDDEAEEEDDAAEEEEEEEEEPKRKKVQVKVKQAKVKGQTSGKSVQEIQDIRNLLKIIRKLGGVEELEKYLEANPDVADQVEEYEDEEVEEEPKPSTTEKPKPVVSISNKNRFSSLPISKKTPGGGTPRPYTSIQRDKATTKADQTPPAPPITPSPTSFKFTNRPKYVTLSRSVDKNSGGSTSKSDTPSSSTETSIVVRYSDDEKLLDEDTAVTSKPVTYVTSVPYSKVTGTSDEETAASEERPRPKYSTFSRPKFSTTSTTPVPSSSSYRTEKKPSVSGESKATEIEAPADEEEYENTAEDEYVDDEPAVITTTTTTTPTTTTAATKPTQAQRIRIPTRKRLTLKPSATTTTTTESPATAKVTFRPINNFSPSNRRNSLFDRRRGSSTTTTTQAPDETEDKESIGSAAVIVTERNVFKESGRRFRQSTTSTPTSTTPETQTRFRSRFRPTTATPNADLSDTFDNFLRDSRPPVSTSTLSPLPSAFQSAVIRRRTRKPLTMATPSTTSTTTTTTTTTPKPVTSTVDPKVSRIVPIPDSSDYYYYVYEDEEDLLDKSQSQSAPSSTFSRRSLNLKTSQEVTDVLPKREVKEKIIPQTIVPLSEKIRLREDGSIECRDKGVYVHPKSCGRNYISCVENEDGNGLKAWVYSCPRSLTFDPIGAMCNWGYNQNDVPVGTQC